MVPGSGGDQVVLRQDAIVGVSAGDGPADREALAVLWREVDLDMGCCT